MNKLFLPFATVVLALRVATPAAAEDACAPDKMPQSLNLTAKQKQLLERIAKRDCEAAKLETRPHGNESLMDVLKIAFGEERRPSGDRAKQPAPDTMPSGLTLPADGQVVFEPGAAAAEGVTSLAVHGPHVDRTLRSAGPFSLPAASFDASAEYQWTLVTGRNSYDARFTVAGPDTIARVKARLAAVAAVESDPTTRLALEAAIEDDEELYSARDATIRQLRRSLAREAP